MRPYYAVLRLRIIHGLQYRTAAYAGTLTQFFWGFMLIMIYLAFYGSAAVAPPMQIEQLVTYIWLQQALLALFMLWYRDEELFNLITTGNIAYELCRPCDIYSFWFVKIMAQRISGVFLRMFPIVIIALLLPAPYRLALPLDWRTFFVFLLALTLGLLVLMAISMFVYITAFITLNPTGSLLMFVIIGDFLSGGVIPIPLMPGWMQQIVYCFPFRLSADLPFRIYSGHIPLQEAWQSIGLQVIWLVGLVITGWLLFNRMLRRVVVQGG